MTLREWADSINLISSFLLLLVLCFIVIRAIMAFLAGTGRVLFSAYRSIGALSRGYTPPKLAEWNTGIDENGETLTSFDEDFTYEELMEMGLPTDITDKGGYLACLDGITKLEDGHYVVNKDVVFDVTQIYHGKLTYGPGARSVVYTNEYGQWKRGRNKDLDWQDWVRVK